MGLFLQTLILPKCRQETAMQAIAAAAQDMCNDPEYDPDFDDGFDCETCSFQEMSNGTAVLLCDNSFPEANFAKAISRAVQGPTMLLYIYDGDFWGYAFYDNDQKIDWFCSCPDAMDYPCDEEPPDPALYQGDCARVARFFSVPEDRLAGYYQGRYQKFDCWEMADFMNELGYPFLWGANEIES